MDSEDEQDDDHDDIIMMMAIAMTRNQFEKSLQLTNFFREIVPLDPTQSFVKLDKDLVLWIGIRAGR